MYLMGYLNAILLASSAAVNAAHINYTTVTGYFLQDDPNTNASTFDYTTTNLGLINRTYSTDCPHPANHQPTQWQLFAHHLAYLNKAAPTGTAYKLLVMGRHGEGYHNAAETYYGTPAWNCYWSLLNGNGTSVWTDPDLTETGIKQALVANAFWNRSIEVAKIPVPQSYYVSPLQRCLETARYTFDGLKLPAEAPFKPVIKEFLREGVSLHTCDRRHNRTYIESRLHEGWVFEDGFVESDPLWSGVRAETSDAQDVRSKTLLDDVFGNDANTYISFTAHSGEITSLLRVLKHRTFSLRTGAVIPVLVKAVTVDETLPTTTPTFTPSPHCTAPPVTSVSGSNGGCVCPSSAAPVTTPLISLGPFRK